MNPAIAMTGRVESWLENPTRRYPVSCTVFVCRDTMDEDPDGLEGAFQFVSKALRYGAGVSVHLSQLRAKGTENEHGMVASGPCGFMEIFSKFNEILRRGGQYRNGAVVCHLDADHKDLLEFLDYDRSRIPWLKRCVNVEPEIVNEPDKLAAIMDAARRGDVWIVKKQYDKNGDRIYSNVCQEILLKSRDTCLLNHINLGICKVEDIPQAFEDGMRFLCELYKQTEVEDSGIYVHKDKQVGLGVLGLANLLAIEGVAYKDFVQALQYTNLGVYNGVTKPGAISEALLEGFKRAAAVAEEHGMSRAFTVAPTASCAYRYQDREGYTTTPEIAPPVSRNIDRASSTLGVQSYEFNPKCETAEEVGWDTFFTLNCEWQRMMDSTGMAHAISMNWWSDMTTMDRSFMARWINSPLKSLYYSLQVIPDTQDKTDIYAALKDVDVDDYLAEILEESDPVQCDCAE